MRLFVWLGSLLVLALLAALVVPPFFDWDRFRTGFEQEASRVLGQPVKVGGGTTARLLPLPSVTFSDIRVGDDKEPMLTAESFHINVELAPLLKGDVVIVDMNMIEPKLDVRIAADGTMDWSLRREGAASLVSAEDVAVENISVSKGIVRVRDERFEREFIIRNIDATAKASTLAGPWRGDAQLSYLGQRIKLEGSTGRLKPSGSINVSATLKPKNQPYDIAFDGPFTVKDGVPSAVGIVTVKPVTRQTDEERIAFPRESAGNALPVRFEGDLEIGSAGASIPAFRMEVGGGDDPYTLIGSGKAVFGEELSFRAKAEGQQINIERLEAADKSSDKTENTSGKQLSARLAVLADLLERVPQFEAEGDIDVKLPAVIAGDTVIRDIALNMRPLEGALGWRLRNVKAQLPGRTEFRADGVLALGNKPSWNGALIVASKQPSGLAKWLAPRVDPAIRKMSGAGFSANAVIDGNRTEFNDLEIALDGARLNGSLLRQVPEGGKPQLSTALSGDKADSDQLAALFRLFSGETGAAEIANHDINVQLDVGELALAGFVAKGVSGSVATTDGALKISDLKIDDLDGARIMAQATLEGFPEFLSGTAQGSFIASNPVQLLQKLSAKTNRFSLPPRFVENPELLANTDVKFALTPDGERTRIKADGQAGGSSIDWKFASDGLSKRLAEQDIDSTLVLVNDNASQLMTQLGIPVVFGDAGGRSAFRGVIKGVPADAADVQGAFTLASGYLSVAGQLTDTMEGSLKVRAEIEDLDPLILLSGLAVPGFGQGLSGELSGALELEGLLMRLTSLDGTLGGSHFSGNLELNSRASPRPSAKGKIHTDIASLETIASTVFSSGAQRNVRLFSGLDADLAASAERLHLPITISNETGDMRDAKARLLVLDGDMIFEDVDARLAEGRLTGRTSISQTAAARTVGGQLTLIGAEAGPIAALVSQEPWFAGDVSISGSFETAGEDDAALISGLTGSGTITVKNGVVLGIDEAALAPVLKAVDALDDADIAEKTIQIVAPKVRDGSFAFGEAQAAFSIASGVVRAGSIRLENERATLDADLALDLSDGSVDADATVAYRAGRESVVAATPEFSLRFSGTPDNRIMKTDTSPFSTYLGLRLSERKQRDFEAQKASILERQRLLRTARFYALKEEKRRLIREEQERIEQLRAEEEERRRLEQIRRAREALEQAKLEADLKAAETQAETEATAEAGRRAKRQEQIELLRRRAEQEAKKRKKASDVELLDFDKLEDG